MNSSKRKNNLSRGENPLKFVGEGGSLVTSPGVHL